MVSLPCWEWFEDQDRAYRAEVLPPGIPRLGVEAAASFGWDRYADASVSIDTFGASAPGEVALAKFGFTPEHVADCARALLGGDPLPPTDAAREDRAARGVTGTPDAHG